jgi:hypothetical protein
MAFTEFDFIFSRVATKLQSAYVLEINNYA